MQHCETPQLMQVKVEVYYFSDQWITMTIVNRSSLALKVKVAQHFYDTKKIKLIKN